MAYGLKYQTQFSSVSDDNNASRDYTLQFLFKDYTGGPTSIEGGSISVIQKCTQDDPVAPIKGQSLDIRLVNDGSLPITSFQTIDDDGVQVKLLDDNSNVLFIGFLVQDDFSEMMVDFSHEITLSANDSLGLLKEVPLSEASVRRAFYAVRRTNGVNTVIYFYVGDKAFYPQASDTIEVDGGTYTIDTAVEEDTVISSIGYNWTIKVTTTTGGIAYGDETIYLTGEINLIERNSLLSVLAVCLAQTNLALVTNIFLNLYEYRQDNTYSTIEQTIIDTQTFISGDNYEDCYSVLSKILTGFNCTLIQANGQWNIVHWFEAREYTDNAIPGFVYDETWSRAGTTTFANNFFIGADPQLTQIIYPLTTTAYRGYKFSRKTFNYKNPKYLLRNLDLKLLGPKIREYQSGGLFYYEYEIYQWYYWDAYGLPQADRLIRVVKDNLGNELERYIVIYNRVNGGEVQSSPVEISEGDIIKLSFNWSTDVSQPGTGYAGGNWIVRIFDGSVYQYARNYEGTLTPGQALTEIPPIWEVKSVPFSLPANWRQVTASNTNQWETVTIQTAPVPFSGLFHLVLTSLTTSTANETRYKDFTFQIISTANNSTKIIGQVHTQEQTPTIKTNSDTEIFVDDSPKSSISGCLFLPTKTGLLQDRTTFWRYPADANGWRLGELTTLEEITWRQKTRQKFEGGFTGNWQNDTPVSLLTMAIFDFDTTKNYTFGLLNIDYKNNRFDGNLWEIHDTEDDSGFDPDYEFKYLYSTT